MLTSLLSNLDMGSGVFPPPGGQTLSPQETSASWTGGPLYLGTIIPPPVPGTGKLSPQETGGTWTGGPLYRHAPVPPPIQGVLSPQETSGTWTGGPLYRNATAFLPIDDVDVLAAISNWWSTRKDLQAMFSGGKLWHKTAPENASIKPYLTYFLVSETDITPTTSFIYWESVVQFNVHHDLPGLARTLAQKLMNALSSLKGKAPIVVQGMPARLVLPSDVGVDEGEGLGLKGRDCWIAHFLATIQWTY